MIRRALAALGVAVVVALAGAPVALAATPTPSRAPTVVEPAVPEPVADYVASGLIPRVTDLFGPGKGAGSGIDFDASTATGEVHRVFAWTHAYLDGHAGGSPVQLTNRWTVPVSVKKQVVGLATIWINPASDAPELADFDLGPALAAALATAPKGYVLVHDTMNSAWFATDGTRLVPLVSGRSGLATATTVSAYQKRIPHAEPASPAPTGNQGLLIAAAVLGVVIVLLAIFVFLPIRRRTRDADAAVPVQGPGSEPEPSSEPEPEPEPDTDPEPDADPDSEPEPTPDPEPKQRVTKQGAQSRAAGPDLKQ